MRRPILVLLALAISFAALGFITSRAQLNLKTRFNKVSVHARTRGRPWISLDDGHDLLGLYEGTEIHQADGVPIAWQSGIAPPLELAA